ncbi:nuclear pore complex protein Nup50-like [Tropilaelaps mercedesae]|uniref:Nuclear pore complex protein Nup50-like n=1 Tax=Tropilaelaps mercedesae TaxID=418985 RepID=A0A1V9XE31_9ACAR|nr:nuclear pore complex protein Nup50-like [Tropilaelaps mercedesae]
MAKRRADKQITHDNWDDEEPVEEVGVFECASEDVLAKRPIRKAKRTLPPKSDESTPRPNPFAGFSFNRNGSSGSAMSTVAVNSNGTGANTRTSDEYLLKVAQLNRDILKFITRLMDTGPYLNLTPCFDDYIKHFQRLTSEEEERQRKNNNNNNISTSTMASSVLSSGGFGSPGSGLTSCKATEAEPKAVFCFGSNSTPKSTDLKTTDTSSTFMFGPLATSGAGNSLQGSAQDAGAPAKFTFGATSQTAPSSSSSTSTEAIGNTLFGSISATSTEIPSSAVSVEKKTDSAVTLKFGATSTTAAADKGGTVAGTPTKPIFSFNSATGFSFGATSASVGTASNMTASTTATTQDANEEEEDEAPPKVDVAPVEEEGSLYTKKVKLFYKKQESDEKGQYADKGVGFLHIKKLEGGGYQLLIRAQTTLGNVLLNVRLGKDMPVKNVGKNNVAIICVPNPRLDPKSKDDQPDPPTMFLIRVKTSEDAVELRDKLIEYKDSV